MCTQTFRMPIIVLSLIAASVSLAGDPPSATEVANTVSGKWLARQFTELDSYIVNLYNSFPNYAPAILAASFRDTVYTGHLSDAMQKVGAVRQWVEQNPQEVEDGFLPRLGILEWCLQCEINAYARRGISEGQLQPNPAAVRDLWGGDLFVPIEILFYFENATTASLMGKIKINEVLSHSTSGSDWIELHNTTDEDKDVGGWFLSDSDQDDVSRKKYEIAAGTTIPADSYRVFTENDHFGNSADPGCHMPFALSQDGGAVYLKSGAGGSIIGYVHQQTFGALESGVSFGTYQKGDGSCVFVAMSTDTPGTVNATPKVGPIVISEVMYHPASNADAEYVELLNISGSTVTLYDSAEDEAWRFVDDESSPSISYSFPTSPPIALLAGGYLLLVKNLAAFNAEGYGDVPAGVPILEWGSGSLGDDGSRPQLLKQMDILVDCVAYDDMTPWPTGPDGTGQSLRRIAAGSYGDDRVNWEAASPTPGR